MTGNDTGVIPVRRVALAGTLTVVDAIDPKTKLVPTTHWAAGGQTVSVHDGPVLGPFSGDGARIGQVALNRWSDPGDQILDVSGGTKVTTSFELFRVRDLMPLSL
jgi:hypothetical protein